MSKPPVLFDLTSILPSDDSRGLGRADAKSDRSALTASALTAEEPRLRRLVHRLLGWPGRQGDVDDVVQDTMLAAWSHRGNFRGDSTIRTWLHRIAVRKAHNHVRATGVRRRFFRWLGLSSEPEATARPADERHDLMQAALQQLGHRDREVLVLRYLEQRSADETAALLGCTRAAVDARLSRARNRLRDTLDLEVTP